MTTGPTHQNMVYRWVGRVASFLDYWPDPPSMIIVWVGPVDKRRVYWPDPQTCMLWWVGPVDEEQRLLARPAMMNIYAGRAEGEVSRETSLLRNTPEESDGAAQTSNHRGFTEFYPLAIRSFTRFSPVSLFIPARRGIPLLTLLRECCAERPLTQGFLPG